MTLSMHWREKGAQCGDLTKFLAVDVRRLEGSAYEDLYLFYPADLPIYKICLSMHRVSVGTAVRWTSFLRHMKSHFRFRNQSPWCRSEIFSMLKLYLSHQNQIHDAEACTRNAKSVHDVIWPLMRTVRSLICSGVWHNHSESYDVGNSGAERPRKL